MLNSDFNELFTQANKRLLQKLNVSDIEIAIEFISSQPKNSCLSIQPGHSGYAWSSRKVIMVFLWNTGSKIRIRFIKKTSIRNSEITPGSFPELKYFPKGNSLEKLVNWGKVQDGLKINIQAINKRNKLPDSFYNGESEDTGSIFYHLWNI